MIFLPDSSSLPLRLGVIGAGWVARACHLPSLESLCRHGWPVSVAAVADGSEAAVAAALAVVPDLLSDAQRFKSGEALLRAASDLQLDAVLLLTPPEVTTELLRLSIALGLATFAEKPVSEEAATLAVLAEAALQDNGPPVQIGYNRRWQPLAPAFRDHVSRLRTTDTGSPALHVEAHLWRAARSEAIFYRDTMIHAVDFLLWCLGPLEVNRVTIWPPLAAGGITSGIRAELRTAGDKTAPATVHLDVRPSVGRSRESYLALGRKTSAELTYCAADRDAEPARLSLWDGTGTVGFGVEEVLPSPVGGSPELWSRGFLGQMAGFLSLAANGSANACSLSDALAARRLTDAIIYCRSVPAYPDES